MECKIISRKDGTLKDKFDTNEYEINCDYLSNENSSFTVSEEVDIKEGDFIVTEDFTGVVKSFEDDKINAGQIYTLADFEIYGRSTKFTREGIVNSVRFMIKDFIIDDVSKSASCVELYHKPFIYLGDGFSYLYAGSVKGVWNTNATAVNFTDFLIDVFKRTGIVWVFKELKEDGFTSSGTPKFKIVTELKTTNQSLQFKNNLYEFVDWEVYENATRTDGANRVVIVDLKGSTMIEPKVKDWWCRDENGELVQKSLLNVSLPTNDKIHIYDETNEADMSMQEIASSELGSNPYSHEISFSVVNDSKIVDYKELQIGATVKIFYNGRIYSSILTGFSKKSNSNFVNLYFGYIRSRFQNLFKGAISRRVNSSLSSAISELTN